MTTDTRSLQIGSGFPGVMADTAVQMTTVDDQNNNVSRTKVSTSMSSSSAKRGAIVSFHNINYSVKMKSGSLCKRKVTKKNILVELNGIMRPGLNAILGPTGSGKSSFLDVLAARKDPAGLSGEVLIDGAPQPPNFKCLSGYVVQDDVVMGTLTVRENLRFSAALRLPKSIRQREKDEKIERLIQELGLSKVADSRVGTQMIRGVSGGERKRTSIGMELIFDPPVLFLDEPTTGLDASTAHSVLMLLKRMANRGRTIILSIHQPRYSIYRLFDSLTLLVGGRLVYHGPAQDTLNYFSQIELDHEQLSSSLKGIEDRLVEEYKNSASYKETKSELERIVQGQDYSTRPKSRTVTYSTSFFHQFHWVLKRTFKNLMLNPQTSVAQVVVMILLALVVGAIFFGVEENSSGIQNRMGALFFITTNQCFSTMSSAELFIIERKLFVHEYISGYYRVSVYFLSKILSDVLFLRTIPGIIFSCVIYWMIGLKSTPAAFFIFLFSIILVSYTATSMALAISADQTVLAIANIFLTIIFIFMMIFSGLLVNLPSVANWLNWLKYFSIPRYGLAALEINEFTSLTFCDMRNISSTLVEICSTGEEFLGEQGINYSTWGLWQNHLALGIMTLIFLIIAYLKLRFIKKFT
ncbi:ATP-binding cassette sub-family G member 2-like protein [Labeo rohita]|uniref:ATP-binding cassette sub-family G member 2-like protein n=1 Tax=Labeo rohita TaxID=84645 RepID=A0A498LJI7_LABRO|nr:ATP-binding cassette sub-family G member 2-like protein [Labeo rohita]